MDLAAALKFGKMGKPQEPLCVRAATVAVTTFKWLHCLPME